MKMDAHDLQTLEDIIARRGGFGHREHLELVWNYLDRYPVGAASEAAAEAIRHVARRHGAPDKYHDTMTQSWVRLVAFHRATSQSSTFDEFVSENPGLLDRRLLERHYSRELLFSDGARSGWIEPDLRDLPAAG
jgi:hypothetical protein